MLSLISPKPAFLILRWGATFGLSFCFVGLYILSERVSHSKVSPLIENQLPGSAGPQKLLSEYSPTGRILKIQLLPYRSQAPLIQWPGGVEISGPGGSPRNSAWTLVSFWAHWCNPCLQELPQLNTLPKLLPDSKALRILLINTDKVADQTLAKSFLHTHNILLPNVFDPLQKLKRAFGAHNLPAHWLVDENNDIRWSHSGWIQWHHYEVTNSLAKLLKKGFHSTKDAEAGESF